MEDNDATLGSLNILANDTMDLREDSEDIDMLGSGSERGMRRHEEGEGFGGTLLGSSNHPSSSPQIQSDHEEAADLEVKAC